jgi:hypothetical protein
MIKHVCEFVIFGNISQTSYPQKYLYKCKKCGKEIWGTLER